MQSSDSCMLATEQCEPSNRSNRSNTSQAVRRHVVWQVPCPPFHVPCEGGAVRIPANEEPEDDNCSGSYHVAKPYSEP